MSGEDRRRWMLAGCWLGADHGSHVTAIAAAPPARGRAASAEGGGRAEAEAARWRWSRGAPTHQRLGAQARQRREGALHPLLLAPFGLARGAQLVVRRAARGRAGGGRRRRDGLGHDGGGLGVCGARRAMMGRRTRVGWWWWWWWRWRWRWRWKKWRKWSWQRWRTRTAVPPRTSHLSWLPGAPGGEGRERVDVQGPHGQDPRPRLDQRDFLEQSASRRASARASSWCVRTRARRPRSPAFVRVGQAAACRPLDAAPPEPCVRRPPQPPPPPPPPPKPTRSTPPAAL